jgi:endonuclease/exonuclease/phosphatase family metal-dependent hydrolase
MRRALANSVGLLLLLSTIARAADAPLRVMSFNLRYGSANDGVNSWPKRQDLLLHTIEAFRPDLLGSQETLAFQAEFLNQKLPGHTMVGVGRDDGKKQGEFSALWYRTERFEALASGTFWLSETPQSPGSKSWDSSLPRIATWVKLRDKQANGGELVFLNTHWDHRGNQARIESGKLIRRWLNENAAGKPAIVTGDLNVTEDHAGIAALLAPDADPKLLDVFRSVHAKAGADEGTFHGFLGRPRGRRIDFIFASPQFKPSEATIDRTSREGRFPSDHFPVTAVLTY